MSRPLNPKQQKFVDRYLATGDATQSYIDAGYTDNRESARKAGARLLTNVTIAHAVVTARTVAAEECAVTAEWALMQLKVLALFDGPRSSHLARVTACRTILEHYAPKPDAKAATHVNVNVSASAAAGTVTDRVEQYAAAFAAVADRTGEGNLPGHGP